MKIVINRCFGGFGVTEPVFKELGKEWTGYGYLGNKDFGIESENYYAYRAHPDLIGAIEKVGIKESTQSLAKLAIVEVPDGIDWELSEYDGVEEVREVHRSWS